MPGVIFLDFDGPIFPSRIMLMPQNRGKDAKEGCAALNLHPYVDYWYADPVAINMLNILHDIYPYDLVISSSWADEWLHERKEIDGLLNKNGLNYTMHEDWRTPRDFYHGRHEQIGQWLKKHPEYNNNYLILDDILSGPCLNEKDELAEHNIKMENIILVDETEGISYKQFLQMTKVVQYWS